MGQVSIRKIETVKNTHLHLQLLLAQLQQKIRLASA
jgi:hypothetical protein